MANSETAFEMPKEKENLDFPLSSGHVIPSIFKCESNTSAFASLRGIWFHFREAVRHKYRKYTDFVHRCESILYNVGEENTGIFLLF